MKNSETAFDFIINNREEIEEIFQDLIDIGYEFNIATYHTNGKFNKIEKQYLDKIKSYYYGFEISLERKNLNDSDGHHRNGSFVYEENTNTLDEISKSIGRFKKTFEYKTYFSLRTIDCINIRVIMGYHKNENIIYNIEKIQNYIENLDDRILDGFKINSYMTTGNQKTLTIKYNPTKDIEKAMREEKDFSNRNKFSTVIDTIFSEIMSVLGEGFRHTGDKSNIIDRYFIFNGPVRVLEISMRMEDPHVEIHNKGFGKHMKVKFLPKFKTVIYEEAKLIFNLG